MGVHDFILYCINIIYERMLNLEKYKELLSMMIDENQVDEIGYLITNDPCSRLSYFKDLNDCHDFSEGIIKEGLAIVLSKFVNNIRRVLENYEKEKIEGGNNYHFLDSTLIDSSCNFINYLRHHAKLCYKTFT